MRFAELIGQTLDEKYRIESELGRGGMGSVYLATHLGTERPVAVKVIAPQFMERPEFIERFRREAKAAGRLRHPNVVDVTDFGFAQIDEGQVAYLVMEYLDGCTLGEILDEEKNLPVSWTLDILEQVCSAVHEAHQQGIIHRDLKPDNIWLEPNLRGGYTVKVLDFGIAKLETPGSAGSGEFPASGPVALRPSGAATKVEGAGATLIHDSISPTMISESATAVQFAHDDVALSEVIGDGATAIMSASEVDDADQDTVGTQLIGDKGNGKAVGISTNFGGDTFATSSLTRVGAVLGTPLYMSPEQCRGERLDARSDVYSLGVIAYQMLAGQTPFTGDFTKVMDAHRDTLPPQLNAKKVRKKLKRVIATALAKEPNERPQTAEAFANSLRSRSEGIWALLRRSVMIYTEHLPKFLGITILLYLPFILATLAGAALGIWFVVESADEIGNSKNIAFVLVTTVTTFTAFFCGYLAVGTITWVVNQILALPLKPVRIRPALRATAKNWKRLLGTSFLSTVAIFIGMILCFVPGAIMAVLFSLVSPVVMMEGLRGFSALKRSKLLVMRSLGTSTAAVAILFFVPMMIGGLTGGVVALSVHQVTEINEKIEAAEKRDNPTTVQAASDPAAEPPPPEDIDVNIGARNGQVVIGDKKRESSMARIARESLTSLLMLPIQILLTSLSAIIFALLYLKTRQAGGENLKDLFIQFEGSEQPGKKWQERVRERLIQSGRISSSNKT